MKKLLLICFLLLNYLFGIDATMEIVKKQSILPKISVSVSSDNILHKKLAKSITELIEKDLEVSGHFLVSNIKFENNFDAMPSFNRFQENGIDLVLNFQIVSNQLNGIIVNSRLYDNNSQKLVMSRSYSTTNKVRYPFISHKMAIDINKYLNAPSIDWMEKFVVFARYVDSQVSEIVISDYTLTYQKVVVKGGLNIFPKWANKNQEEFYYTSYNYGKPTLMKQNLFTGKKEKILSSDGMIVCSDVSSDGKKLVLTMAPNSQPDIYVYDTQTKLKTRITNYSGIDVGGSFVENDSKIVFVSDRLKYPNIFSKNKW